MKEQEILAACMDSRAAYDQINSHVNKTDFSVLGWKAYQQVQDWYERDVGAQSAPRAAVLDRLFLLLSQDKHKQAMREFFSSMPAECSAENAATTLLQIKRANKSAELAAYMFDHPEDTDKLRLLTEQYLELLDATKLERSEITYGERTARGIIQRKRQHGTISLYPPRLDRAVDGSCMPGHHILVFGRPESGKTLLVLNLVGKFLLQQKRVLYVGNEDPQDAIDSRLLSRLCRQPAPWVEANIDSLESRLNPILANYVSVHMTPGSIAEIEREIKAAKPHVLVVDQIRNLDMGGTSDPQGDAGIAVRALAGRHGLVVVSVTQARDMRQRHSEELPIWLDQGDVHGSRTTLPGQCDLMIGLGVNEDLERLGQRALRLCRNKMSGRHESFLIRVDPTRNLILPD